jgi:hypothetical protein
LGASHNESEFYRERSDSGVKRITSQLEKHLAQHEQQENLKLFRKFDPEGTKHINENFINSK